jgi:cephalosporin hydroxylase
LGRPIIQYPQDIVAIQQLIFTVKPSVIVETGIAHGGSLVLSASILELVALCGGDQNSFVVGVDIDIRQHNRVAIESHPLAKRIRMIEGSSTSPEVVSQVKEIVNVKESVMVLLDSHHSHDHVLSELEVYAPMVTPGSYCVVFDSFAEYLPDGTITDRPWGKGNNPMTAIDTFLASDDRFTSDRRIDAQLLISVSPKGYLRRNS